LPAVADGSKRSPVIIRWPPLAACTTSITCGADSVPSGLIEKRWIRPVMVAA
jgi:hypothetical protein